LNWRNRGGRVGKTKTRSQFELVEGVRCGLCCRWLLRGRWFDRYRAGARLLAGKLALQRDEPVGGGTAKLTKPVGGGGTDKLTETR